MLVHVLNVDLKNLQNKIMKTYKRLPASSLKTVYNTFKKDMKNKYCLSYFKFILPFKYGTTSSLCDRFYVKIISNLVYL